MSFPGTTVVRNPPANAGDAIEAGSIRGSEDPWSRKWQPLQYFYLGNSMDREAGLATVHGVAKNRTQLSD